jgi:hypothetical protein
VLAVPGTVYREPVEGRHLAAARLDDPHVVPIHDVGEIGGRLLLAHNDFAYLTGELPFPGTTLEQIVMGHMVMSPPEPSEDRGNARRRGGVSARGCRRGQRDASPDCGPRKCCRASHPSSSKSIG